MTTDKKTLADVQPGGRVRLVDQAERARFEAWVKNHVSSLARAADGEYASNFTHALWSAWQAALSAQPSPGGQRGVWMLPDDARIVGVIADSIERGKLDHPGFHRNTQLGEVLRRVLSAALAARQPVGEPVVVAHRYIQRYQSAEHSAWLSGDADETYVEAERQGFGRIERAYAAPPAQAAQAVDLGGNEGYGTRYVPPEQAVDLGQFRDSVVQAISNVSYMTGYGPAYEKLTELLALIDSQAVGNG